MRKLLIALLVALPFAALAAPSKTVTLAVQNMTYPLCPITVKKSLEKVAGVSGVQADFDKKTAPRAKTGGSSAPVLRWKASLDSGRSVPVAWWTGS